MAKVYVVGSLENPLVPETAARLREDGHDVFDSWYAAGPNADRHWRKHEEYGGHGFIEALGRPAAQNVLAFDRRWAEWSDVGVLVLPAGRSSHLELGSFWINVPGKEAHILLDPDWDPEKWDVMYGLAKGVWDNPALLRAYLKTTLPLNRLWGGLYGSGLWARPNEYERWRRDVPDTLPSH